MFGLGKKKETREDDPTRLEEDVKYGRAVLKEKRRTEALKAERERIRYELSGKKERDEIRSRRINTLKSVATKTGQVASKAFGGLASLGKPHYEKGKKGFHKEKVVLKGNKPEENKYVSPLFSGTGSNPLLEQMEKDRVKKKSSGSPLFDELTRR